MEIVEEPIATLIADGAYDRFSCYEAMQKKGGRGICPPQQNAVTSQERPQNKKKASPEAVAKRDEAIKNFRSLGRAEWKKQTGYHRRSLAETAMSRIKTMLGKRLTSRLLEHQELEAKIWCRILNHMTQLGMP